MLSKSKNWKILPFQIVPQFKMEMVYFGIYSLKLEFQYLVQSIHFSLRILFCVIEFR